MNTPIDPAVYKQREQRFLRHVEQLLKNDRLSLATRSGKTVARRPMSLMQFDVWLEDRGVELKRLMGEMGRPDRKLEANMPVNGSIEVDLWQKRWRIKRPRGRLLAVAVSPWRALLEGQTPQPMNPADVARALGQILPPRHNVPSTLVMMSTTGFTPEAAKAVEKNPSRTVILVEPTESGGWRVHAPEGEEDLADLLDPEAADDKRQRIRAAIEGLRVELMSGGVSAEKIASQTHLSPQLVESELKSYAGENSGLVAKRLDGQWVLYRDGGAWAPPVSASAGADMPFIERVKALFGRKGEVDKKIAFLSERRAVLSQQSSAGYEDMNALEAKDAELCQEFKDAGSDITRRRVTSQLVQLRKDIERRQQLLSVLNQQVNVVNTHLHNLQLQKQGQAAKLPDSEELASDAAAAEEVLAELQASTEAAATAAGIAQTGGLSAEEQALYEELTRQASDEKEKAGESLADAGGAAASASPGPKSMQAVTPPPLPQKQGGSTPQRGRNEAEAG